MSKEQLDRAPGQVSLPGCAVPPTHPVSSENLSSGRALAAQRTAPFAVPMRKYRLAAARDDVVSITDILRGSYQPVPHAGRAPASNLWMVRRFGRSLETLRSLPSRFHRGFYGTTPLRRVFGAVACRAP